MFLGFCVLLVLALCPLLGGDLRRLGGIRFRLTWVIFAALFGQVVVISLLPAGNHVAAAVAHDLTYVAALVVIAVNWRVPGLVLVGLGTFSNGLAIAVNGGTLPASAAAARAAHFHKHGEGLTNSGVLAHPHLAWLGDNWATPGFLPLRNTMSVGDVLILVGAAYLLLRVTGALRLGRRDGHNSVPAHAGAAMAAPAGLDAAPEEPVRT